MTSWTVKTAAKKFSSKHLTMMLLNQACQQFSIKEKRRKQLALSTQ